MSSPAENFEIATDEYAALEARTTAISGLKMANECEKLETLVEGDDVADEVREHALDALAEPQCEATLESLATQDGLPEALGERARSLLDGVGHGNR